MSLRQYPDEETDRSAKNRERADDTKPYLCDSRLRDVLADRMTIGPADIRNCPSGNTCE